MLLLHVLIVFVKCCYNFYEQINKDTWQGGMSAECLEVSECTRCHEGGSLHETYRSLAHRYGKGTERV